MAFELARIHLFDRDMEPVPEIAPSELISAVMSEEINGEHELVITTPRRLEEGWRALTVDATGKWREWVVTETPQEHSSGAHAIGTYRFVWSLQYDLTNSYFHDTGEAVSIGMGTDTTASTAAQYIVDAAVGWTVGNCDAPDIAAGTGCVFIRESAWSKLSKLVECTGFEVDSDIDVDRVHAGISGSDQYCVRNRDIILTSHVGSEVATRRFDWGYDIANIKRTPDPGPYYCRVVPLGKGEQEYADDDETTFDYPIDITEEVDEHGNPYPYYLQDDEAAAVFRIKSSYDGSWIYPTIAVSYNEDDPELLLKAAQEDLHKYTRPNVTYEADVLQFSQAGMDVRGVALGDEVQIVDHGFNPDAALRLQGRVTKIETDLLSPETGTTLTIGNMRDNMADALAEANSELDALVSQNADIRKSLAGMNTTRYVQELLERINTEIAATGGYTYLVEGEGLITYDKAVVNPLSNLAPDGTYATRVIQLKGGYLRIAEDVNAGLTGIDDWNFTTLLEAGHIVSDLITAVKITSGYIGNATNNVYINLDNGNFTIDNTLNTVLAEDSITISQNMTYSSGSLSYNGNEPNSYLISFTTNKQISNNMTVGLGYPLSSEYGRKSLYSYNEATTKQKPTIVSVNGSEYRYAAVVTPVRAHSSDFARLFFKYYVTYEATPYGLWIGFDDTEYTVTDARVYKLPNKTLGSIDIYGTSNDGIDKVSTNITAGSMVLLKDSVRSELSPGNLSLSDSDYSTTIEFTNNVSISYDSNNKKLRLVRQNKTVSTGYSDYNYEFNLDFTEPSIFPGYLARDGIRIISETDSSNIAYELPGGPTSFIRGRIWGAVTEVYGVYVTSSDIEIPANTGSYGGVKVLDSFTLKNEWQLAGQVAPIYSSSILTNYSIYVAQVTIMCDGSHVQFIVPQNPTAYTIPASSRMAFKLTFLRGSGSLTN